MIAGCFSRSPLPSPSVFSRPATWRSTSAETRPCTAFEASTRHCARPETMNRFRRNAPTRRPCRSA